MRALRDLVELRVAVDVALCCLAEFDWSSEEELITVRVHDIVRALKRYESESLSETELVSWAEALQGREDISLDEADREVLADALFALSTPEICGPMSVIVAKYWEERGGLA